MVGGTGVILRNNKIHLPVWTSTEAENTQYNKTRAINLVDCDGLTLSDNICEGGYSSVYSDTGELSSLRNVLITRNIFKNCLRGGDLVRAHSTNAVQSDISPIADVQIIKNSITLSPSDDIVPGWGNYVYGIAFTYHSQLQFVTNPVIKRITVAENTIQLNTEITGVGVYGVRYIRTADVITHDNVFKGFEDLSGQHREMTLEHYVESGIPNRPLFTNKFYSNYTDAGTTPIQIP